MLIGFDLTRFKVNPGLRFGIYVNNKRNAYYTKSDQNYAAMYNLDINRMNFQYYLELLIKYEIANRLNLNAEAGYHWSIDTFVEDIPNQYNPTRKFEISIGIEYILIKRETKSFI